MDEKNINISKSEEELLEIMENRSHITTDQLHNLKEDEECLQAYSDLAEIVIEMYNPQIEMFARFKMKSSFHKTKRII